ncbi:hypothetical protein HanRHA438_Chr15g0694621 [Helianthus annuus]|nr:hypothetical protein HanRHA438_Chr15g0694621 [Helianthus annuus]
MPPSAFPFPLFYFHLFFFNFFLFFKILFSFFFSASHNHTGFHALAHTTGVSFHNKNIPATVSAVLIPHPSLYRRSNARTSSHTSSLYATALNPQPLNLLDHFAAVSRRSTDSSGEHATRSITARPAALSNISRSLLVFGKFSSNASK